MLDATKVRELSFSDVYLGHPVLGDLFANVPGAPLNPLPANGAMRSDLALLKTACIQAGVSARGADFKVTHDGMAYRASVMHTFSGEVYVLRKMEDTVWSLADTGIPQVYFPRLMDPGLSGLFVVAGAAKSGKTTTACALVKARLKAYAGIAVTAENPIELPLEGSHGDGVCYQTHAAPERGGYVEAFRRCLRTGAKLIFIGEIQDREVAIEALQASLNGHLIIATMQATSVVRTIAQLQMLASERLDPSAAQSMLADGLAGVLHLKISTCGRRKLETEFLFLKDALPAQSAIRQGRYEMLASEIRQQVATMIIESGAMPRVAGR